MATRILMPKLGLTMTEGTVVRWMKKEGDRVEKDEVILVVMSEKIEYEMEAPASGNLAKIIAKEEENYPVGATLAVITAEGEEIPEDMLKEIIAPAASAAARERVAKPPRPPRAAVREPGERLKISPVARKMAQELGLDVDALVGSGPGGRIVKEDVLKAAEAAAETALPGATPESDMDVLEVIPLKGIRKVIADRMQQSWDNTPRVTEVMEADMTAAEAFRKENLPGWEKGFSTRVTYNDFIVKAVALALQEHPLLNSTIVNGEVRQFKDVNVGVAVAVDEGLIVPVIQRTQRKTLIDISRESRALAEKAREKKLNPDDVARRTFSITNLGAFGVEIFTPIVNFPDNAILGVGKITRKPVVVDDEVVIRSMMYLSLVFNHKVVDGVPAARFLSRVKEILENPDTLLS